MELPGRQLAVLYARLAVDVGRPVARADLIEAVWGEEAPPSAPRTLSALLSRLRGLLGSDAITHGDATVALRGNPTIDVLELLDGVAAAADALAVGELDRACALAREARLAVSGPLLPGNPSPWAGALRERVNDALARASEIEAAALLAMGDPRAVGPAREVVAHDPFRESGVVLLVDALLAAGDPAGALRAYDALRVRLRDDLGAVPGPRARAAHRRALEAELDTAMPRPDILGRDDELARITAWLERSRGPVALAVQGERGIGLSTLVRAAAGRAAATGWLVARGTCPPLPLEDHAGLAELLRDLVVQLEAGTRSAVPPAVAPLAALVPALGSAGSATGPLAPAIAQLLRVAVEERRVLLVLEDLHHAEARTLRLLGETLAGLGGSSLRVVLTTAPRADEVGAMLGALRRSIGVADLELGRLRRADLEALAARHVPDAVLTDALLEEVWEATCGHPLLLVELLRDLAAQRDSGRAPAVRVAPAVRQLVLDAAQELPSGARQVLALVAAAGRPLLGATVAAAFRRDPEQVAADLEAARAVGLLARREDGAAAFSVPIIGRAFRDDLDPLALRGLNLRLARASAEDPVARPGRRVEVAMHLLAAEELTDREEVGRAAVAAAREAIDERDPARAVDLCERALKLVRDGAVELRLRILLAEAHYRLGDAAEARRIRLSVAADAERLGDREAQLAAALDHDRPLEMGEHHPEDQAMLERLLDVLPPDGPERAAATARLAVVAHHGPTWQRHLGRADEAVTHARAAGDAGALARALAAKRFDAQRPGYTARERRELTAALVAAVEAAGWSSGASFAATWQAADRWEAGDGLGFRAAVRRLQETIEPLHEPFWLLSLRCMQAAEALAEGRLDDAEQILRATPAEVGGARHDTTLATAAAMFMVRRTQGRAAELMPTFDGFGEPPGPWPGPRALALAASEREEEAQALLDLLAADDWRAVPRDVQWNVSAACVAEAVVLTGARDHAQHWYDALLPAAGTAIVGQAVAWLPVDQLLGGLAQLRGDHATARRHYEVALGVARGLQAPTYEAEAQAALDALAGLRERDASTD